MKARIVSLVPSGISGENVPCSVFTSRSTRTEQVAELVNIKKRKEPKTWFLSYETLIEIFSRRKRIEKWKNSTCLSVGKFSISCSTMTAQGQSTRYIDYSSPARFTWRKKVCCAMPNHAIEAQPFPAVIVNFNHQPAREARLMLFSGSCTFNCNWMSPTHSVAAYNCHPISWAS